MRSRKVHLIPILLGLMAPPTAHAQEARKPLERVLVLDSYGRNVSIDSVSENRLPLASTVHFRPPTIWQQYEGYIAGALGLVALQTALIAGLLLQGRRRRRVEEGLASSEQRLQLIANSLPALIVHVDRDQRYTFANRAYHNWLGLGPGQIVGRTIRELLGEVRYRGVRPYVERALAGEKVSCTIETTIDGGGPRSVELVLVPDYDELGAVKGFYSLALDVTVRVRAQHEARRLLYELAHADRMSMMGELAAAMAHEVNQPLAAILSNAQAAQRFLNGPTPDLDEVRDIVGDIADDCARAGEVLRQMRSLVKKENADFQSLDVNQVLHKVIGLVRNDAMIHKVAVELRLDPDLPAVYGDRIQLQQVVMNLLLNAFDAIEGGASENRTVQVEAHERDSNVRVTVRDHGPGIRREILERLFEPFNTSKEQGLGMGLSISRSIVGVHGGRIWAENNADGGATFSFALPVHSIPAFKEEVRNERAVARRLRGG